MRTGFEGYSSALAAAQVSANVASRAPSQVRLFAECLEQKRISSFHSLVTNAILDPPRI
jgi:hypothetical protein